MNTLTLIFILGVFFSIMSLKFIIEPKEIEAISDELTRNHGLMLIAGLVPLIIGLLILGFYPPLSQNQTPELIASFLGCVFFSVGTFRLLFRKTWIKLVIKYSAHQKLTQTAMIIAFILGLGLMTFGLIYIP